MYIKRYLRHGLVISLFIATRAFAADAEVVERLVEVDGVNLNVVEQGKLGPTVVFVSGLGENNTTWKKIQPAVSGFAKTVSYDRAGLGKSERTTKSRGVDDLARELHSLLMADRQARPFVLVGHSLGGAIIRVYAGLYPGTVAGLVFVDPEDGRLLETLRARMTAEAWASRETALEKALPTMPAPVQEELKGLNASAPVVRAAAALPKVPVALLTGTKKNPAFPGNPLEQDLKLEIHRADLARVPAATHILVPTSRHYIQNDEPQQVIDAIKTVLGRLQ